MSKFIKLTSLSGEMTLEAYVNVDHLAVFTVVDGHTNVVVNGMPTLVEETPEQILELINA